MTSPQLEVLALLYEAYFENQFAFKGIRGSACQMLYSRYAQNPYRELLGLKKDDEGTNFKAEFVLHNLIKDTNFLTFLKEETRLDKKIRYYKLSPEGVNLGRLLHSKEPENVETAKQVSKKYDGEKEELPKEYYQAELKKAQERNYFLEGKIKEFQSFIKILKEVGLADVALKVHEKIKEYKV
jgi:hypothetical protein